MANKAAIVVAIETQIEAIAAQSMILRDKLARGETLTEEEQKQLSSNSDRIGQHLRELEKLGEI